MSAALVIEICEIFIDYKGIINITVIEKMARFYKLNENIVEDTIKLGLFILAIKDKKIKAKLLLALDEYIRPNHIQFNNAFMTKYLLKNFCGLVLK